MSAVFRIPSDFSESSDSVASIASEEEIKPSRKVFGRAINTFFEAALICEPG
jgi:hypothetical protein